MDKQNIDYNTLYNLYVTQQLSLRTIAKMLKSDRKTLVANLKKYAISVRSHKEASIVAGQKRFEENNPIIDKVTLTKLYVNEAKSAYYIAEKYKCSIFVVYRLLKTYGIDVRGKEEYKKMQAIKVSKTELDKLYNKQGKTTKEIAEMFNCSSSTILNLLKKHDFELKKNIKRDDPYANVTKKILKELYLKNKNSIYDIANQFNCSHSTIYNKLKHFGIKMKDKKTSNFDGLEKSSKAYKQPYKPVTKDELYELFVNQTKSVDEIAEYFGRSKQSIYRKMSEHKIGLKDRYSKITKEMLEEMYVVHQLTLGAISNEIGVGEDKISQLLKDYEIPIRNSSQARSVYLDKNPNVSKEVIYDLYVTQNMPVDNICKLIGLSRTSMYKYLKKYDIPKRKN